MTIRQKLDKAFQHWNNDNQHAAFQQLVAAIHDLDRREQRKAHIANRLVAENMFAIVRLEIAHGTEQIINNALAVKRVHTGSGKADFALNVTGTLVMLAGNILTAGSMSLLGNILVATGETLQGLAEQSVEKTAQGVLKLTTATTNRATNEGATDYKKQRKEGFQLVQKDTVVNNELDKQNTTQGVTAIMDKSGEALIELVKNSVGESNTATPESYEVVQKTSAFIFKHGAGGTHAVTFDVQEAVAKAYSEGLTKLNRELVRVASDSGPMNVPPDSILGGIVNAPMQANLKGLHPMTQWVLKRATEELAKNGGAHYSVLTGGSGMFGRASVLQSAKDDVKKSYRIMSNGLQATGSVPQLDDVLKDVKSRT